MMKRLTILSLVAGSLFGGQSLRTTAGAANATISQALTARVVGCISDWSDAATSGTFFQSGSTGWHFQWLTSTISVVNDWDTAGGVNTQIPIRDPNLFGTKILCFSLQRDNTANTELVEAWNGQGVRVTHSFAPSPTSTPTASTEQLTSSQVNWDFYRIYSTLVTDNSRQPVTFDTSTSLLNWKFDGDLLDASGNGHTATISGGTAAYVTTPFQNVVAIIKSPAAPGWGNIVAQRAGDVVTFYGADSFSMADDSSSVSCFWQVLSGPTTPVWSSHTACSPTIKNTVFGDYNAQLTVTASGGTAGLSNTTNTATDHFGLVSTDPKGVVVQSNPNIDKVFGPMLALGKSPWQMADAQHYCGMLLKAQPGVITQAADCAGQIGNFDETGVDGRGAFPTTGPVWMKTGQGNVDYTFAPFYNAFPTTLASDLSSGNTTSMTVVNAAALTGLTFPAVLRVGNPFVANSEIVWVCSVSVNTLFFCDDGRHNPATWVSGDPVILNKVTGHSTLFLTDPVTSICQAGGPPNSTSTGTPAGHTVSSGTATFTHGSTGAIAVTGPTWNADTVSVGGATNSIVVHGIHSGVASIFYATVVSQSGGTSLVMDRAYPAAWTDGDYSYTILSYLSMAPYVVRADPTNYGTGAEPHYTDGCGSETSAFLFGALGNSYAGQTFTGVPYTYVPGYPLSYAEGAFDPNFYGESAAHQIMWLRTGLNLPRDAGRNTALWVKNPVFDSGFSGTGQPFNVGGAVISALTCVITDPGCPLHWTDVRQLANWGAKGTYTCGNEDSRGMGYGLSPLVLTAVFDPAPPTANFWTDKVDLMYTSDAACATPYSSPAPYINSWADANAHMSISQGPIPFVNGSATASFTGLGAQFCTATASGTATIVNGAGTMTIATGTLPASIANAPNGRPNGGAYDIITITGTKSGVAFWVHVFFMGTGGGVGTVVPISGLWPGDTGTVSWMYQPDTTTMGIGGWSTGSGPIDFSDPALRKNWACSYNGTTITLNSLWEGNSCLAHGCGIANSAGNGGPAGLVQQAFMLTLRGQAFKWGSYLSGSRGTNYAALATAAATWQHDYGYDPVSDGFAYLRGAGCEPPLVPTPGSDFGQTQPDCNSGLNVKDGIMTFRELTAENLKLVRVYHEATNTTASRDYGDLVFGSLFGNPAYKNTGVYVPSKYNIGGLNLRSQQLFKWYGFYWGMGMAHQWPATRLGGVDPAITKTVAVSFALAGVPTSDHVVVSMAAPSGATPVTTPCTTSPCAALTDARQGAHLATVTYLNSSNKVLSVSDPFEVK